MTWRLCVRFTHAALDAELYRLGLAFGELLWSTRIYEPIAHWGREVAS